MAVAYKRYETELFAEQLQRIRRLDKVTAERIDRVLSRLLENPEMYDKLLKGPRAGQCCKRAAGQKYRIVYKYCKLCLRLNGKKCAGCDLPDDAVIFREVFRRDEGYD
jgi:mRNA-degrading endonuclease RelE of RelBE toxin-antitoxin system